MIFKINGVDIVPFIAFGGIKWQREDIDGPGAGRDLTGDLRRNRIATKWRADITCIPLNKENTRMILNLVMPEFVTVRCDHPVLGIITRTMYSNNNPVTYCIARPDGTELWSGITFPLIEK